MGRADNCTHRQRSLVASSEQSQGRTIDRAGQIKIGENLKIICPCRLVALGSRWDISLYQIRTYPKLLRICASPRYRSLSRRLVHLNSIAIMTPCLCPVPMVLYTRAFPERGTPQRNRLSLPRP
jgi:hypothetical protein